jgi:hypothetical protein
MKRECIAMFCRCYFVGLGSSRRGRLAHQQHIRLREEPANPVEVRFVVSGAYIMEALDELLAINSRDRSAVDLLEETLLFEDGHISSNRHVGHAKFQREVDDTNRASLCQPNGDQTLAVASKHESGHLVPPHYGEHPVVTTTVANPRILRWPRLRPRPN